MVPRKCIIIICCLLLTGCVEKEIVDDINIETVEGFDLLDNAEIRGTYLIPIYRADKTISNETFTAVSNLNRDILKYAQKESSAPIVNGSLEMVLFNKKLAEEGIIKLVDGLQRDASIGTGLYLAIVDGDSKDLLEMELGNQGTGDHLMNLMKHNINRRDVPKTNLHIFLTDYYQKGKDPNLPILKQTDDQAKIVGVAVLKGDKLEYEIPIDQLFYFKLLVDRHSKGTVSLKVKDKDEYISISSIKTNKKVRVEWKKGMPEIFLTLKVDGALKEFTGNKVDPKKIEEFQKIFKEEIQAQASAMITMFQESGVDPIGFGYEVKSRKRGFDFKKWEDHLYPAMKVHIDTEVTIISTGITE